jgi:hypothetical protein
MSQNDVMATLMEKVAQLEKFNSTSSTTTTMGDTHHHILKASNVNAAGFKSLDDCIRNERRNGRSISRNLLITEEAVLLISQTLTAHSKLSLDWEWTGEEWQEWDDKRFFAEMLRIYPTGGQHSHSIQDALRLVECNWFLDSHRKSILAFVAAINEVQKTYEPERLLAAAAQPPTLKQLERRSVEILLNRVIAGMGDSVRQPATVRLRLKTLCTKGGPPDTVAELITRLLRQSEKISLAVIEAAECGLATSRIGKQDLQGNLVRAQDALLRQREIPPAGAIGKNCNGCGKDNHVRNNGSVLTCKLSVHPTLTSQASGPSPSTASGTPQPASPS